MSLPLDSHLNPSRSLGVHHMSIILDLNNVDAQDQIFPIHEFHSLLQKMNIEQFFIFDDVTFRKKKPQMNHFTCSLLEILAHIKLSS
jgi:hypothetical protein